MEIRTFPGPLEKAGEDRGERFFWERCLYGEEIKLGLLGPACSCDLPGPGRTQISRVATASPGAVPGPGRPKRAPGRGRLL